MDSFLVSRITKLQETAQGYRSSVQVKRGSSFRPCLFRRTSWCEESKSSFQWIAHRLSATSHVSDAEFGLNVAQRSSSSFIRDFAQAILRRIQLADPVTPDTPSAQLLTELLDFSSLLSGAWFVARLVFAPPSFGARFWLSRFVMPSVGAVRLRLSLFFFSFSSCRCRCLPYAQSPSLFLLVLPDWTR